jgi:hypothetical protein
VWHWYRAGRLVSRTLIDEERASHSWRGIVGDSFAGEPVPDQLAEPANSKSSQLINVRSTLP